MNIDWLNEQPVYLEILKEKQEYYGKTEAAYEFASSEYAQAYYEWRLKEPVAK